MASDLSADRPTARLGFRPLYQQVRDMFVQRMVDGTWLPGQALPSEIELAAEVGVSQGTVRKALDAMAAENLLVRRQGRGTFVAEHDETRILFRFFKLVPDHGERSFPESRVLGCTTGPSDADAAAELGLALGDPVTAVRRERSLGGRPVIIETVTVSAALFPGLGAMADIPNNLYGHFATQYGITIGRARERLKAVALMPADAAALQVASGHPALRIDRVALALDGQPVEWRVSLCLTDDTHYLSDLR